MSHIRAKIVAKPKGSQAIPEALDAGREQVRTQFVNAD